MSDELREQACRTTIYSHNTPPCNFRDLPQPRDFDDELRAEPWFYVGSRDIFPEELITFLGFPPDLRQTFLQAHQDLLGADYWRKMQARHQADEVIDILPYRRSRRLGA